LQATDSLTLLAQLSVAVLGFSGVVAVLGRRASGDWTELDRERFLGMVDCAVLALVLSLLPLPMLDAKFSEAMVWGWCSAIGALVCALVVAPRLITIASPSIRSNPAVSKLSLVYGICALIAAPLLLALNAAGVVLSRTSTPYLVASLLVFGFAVLLFLRLLRAEVAARR
jgi:hypothetical protein